jgi:hypothetical protein
MMINPSKLALPILIIIYFVIGFVAQNSLIEIYFHGKSIVVEDIGAFVKKPFIDALIFASGISVLYFMFVMVNKYRSLKKEMIFHAKFLLTNIILLVVIIYLSCLNDVRLNENVISITFDDINFYPYYVISTLVSFIVFFFLRKKKNHGDY